MKGLLENRVFLRETFLLATIFDILITRLIITAREFILQRKAVYLDGGRKIYCGGGR